MSQMIRNTTLNSFPDAFDIKGEKDIFDQIVADQKGHAQKLRPEKNWDLEIGGHNGQQYFLSQRSEKENIALEVYSDDVYYAKYSSLKQMLDPMVGCIGLQSIDNEVVKKYYDYLRRIDYLDILSYYFKANGEMKDEAQGLIVTDLGSIIDINLIKSFLDPRLERYNILEVGGGYGRLAEVFFNLKSKARIKYVLLDAVPACLMYSFLYLKKYLPDLRIGFYYHKDPYDMDLFDCYIMPSWHFDIFKCAGTFDCCINIQSMQEMNQYHVDFYLNMFDQVLKNDSGIAYISNEKDYIFQGKWSYPRNWKCLFKSRTPRSWTRNSPTEVFEKCSGSFEKQNELVDFVYSLQLKEFDRNVDQLKLISKLELELRQSKQKISDLKTTPFRAPLVLEYQLTVEEVEEVIRGLSAYYRSKQLSHEVRLFENLNKANAHLFATNRYLEEGRYRQAISHLLKAGMLNLPSLFSIPALKIILKGLGISLRKLKARLFD